MEEATGFFKSIRGVKKCNPLSPTLFILAAGVLGRALHALYDNPYFNACVMPKWSQNINYLCYADDTIIFSSSHYGAIQLIMNVREEYENASGQKSFNGIPLYSRRKSIRTSSLKCKIRLHSWKGKLLSIGGRAILIAHVLESMPIHLLSAVNPLKHVITQLHKMFAKFYWSNSENGKARQWASFDTLYLPKEEGGVGFRSLYDVSKALFGKL
ncbi:uncharacterized protein LOC142175937 [Nicotiana tabacum]|uniref:Uncharacterized protein LOC142175937 n=1 Tax=Nicotiana tabacum TaxID=4097 RepID=A0AC58TP96_TOBAC